MDSKKIKAYYAAKELSPKDKILEFVAVAMVLLMLIGFFLKVVFL